jgi:hypothetical protein
MKMKSLLQEAINEISIMRRSFPKTEAYGRKLSSSGTYEDYEIELDSVTIPGIAQPTDAIVVRVNIEYDANPGHEARGMYGPPENSEPGEGPSLESFDYEITSFTVANETGQEILYDDLKKLTPEQLLILKKLVADHMTKNEKAIDDMIMSKVDFSPDPPEREKDDFDDPAADYVYDPLGNR